MNLHAVPVPFCPLPFSLNPPGGLGSPVGSSSGVFAVKDIRTFCYYQSKAIARAELQFDPVAHSGVAPPLFICLLVLDSSYNLGL